MKVKLNLQLSDIDGNQIIEYLQKNYDGSIEFVSQEIIIGHENKPFYKLYFSRTWNNWGHESDFEDNSISIDNDEIYVFLEEPWEGGGDEEEIEEILSEWLKTYTFEKINYKEKFDKLMSEIYEELIDKIDKKTSPEEIDAIIEKLKISKTYL
jgi:glutathione peroxidase-family protein